MSRRNKLQDQSRQLTCCWKNTLHAEPTMCSIGLEESNVQHLLLGLTMSNGREIHMSNSHVFLCNRLIGDAHLLYLHIFRHGVLTIGCLSLWDHRFTFNQDGISRV